MSTDNNQLTCNICDELWDIFDDTEGAILDKEPEEILEVLLSHKPHTYADEDESAILNIIVRWLDNI